MKGAGKAARALTSALKKAEKEVRKRLAKEGDADDKQGAAKILGDAYYKIVEPVMDQYSEFGASDTEPRVVAQDYLEKIANEMGIHGYMDF